MNCEYEVGTHIDLSYIGRGSVARVQKKSSFQKAADNLVEVGTQISFKLVNGQFKTIRRIPVVSI